MCSQNRGNPSLNFLKKNVQLVLILIAIIIGIVAGVLVQRSRPSEETIMWLGFPGELFLRIFNMCIVPLIIFGVISGSSAVDPKSNGKAGVIALFYSMGLNVAGCFLGLLLCLAIKPGSFMETDTTVKRPETNLKTSDIFADLFRNIFTDNVVRATMQKARTDYVEKIEPFGTNMTGANITLTRTLVHANTQNMLGVLFFSIIFGLAIGTLGKKAILMHNVAEAGMNVVILLLQWFMWVCPIGVASLIIAAIAKQGDLVLVMAKLGMFIVTCLIGNLSQICIIYPLLFFVVTRRNPLRLMLDCSRLLAIAFATDSSVLIMPEYFTVCRKAGYDECLSSMVIPLITTLSSSGSALYVGAASLFIAQYGAYSVGAGQVIVMGFLGSLSCFAVPASPGGSIIIVLLILQTVAIPSELAGILFSVDWLLDRLRTSTNAVSKALGAAFVNELCKKDLSVDASVEMMCGVRDNGHKLGSKEVETGLMHQNGNMNDS